MFWGKFLMAVSVVIGALTLMTYEEHKSSDKYQRDCQSHVPAVPSTRSRDSANRTDECQDPKKYMPWWYVLIAWPDGIGAWAVILTVIVISWQSYETRKAAEATEIAVRLQKDIGKRQLRAYMVLRRARLILHEDGFVEAKIELANCGQTPAYDLRGASLCRFTTYPIRNVPPIPGGMRQSQSTIGAGRAFHILAPGGRHDNGNREHLLRKLSAGDVNLVYCTNSYYTYKDIFQDSHWIKLQLIVGGPGGVQIDNDTTQQWASFSNDSEGNEEDYEAQNPK
jgi:hypothetical protein